MKRTILFPVLLSCLQVNATIRHVPSGYATIQQAILASVDGDTVLVEPGTYFENLNFRGRKIVLTSRYYLAKDTSFICSTVINGSTPLFADSASCIVFNHNEDSTTVIQGFTITGGKGSKWLDMHGAGTYREGGGILTEFSSPVIRWNRIVNNQVINQSGVNGTGGGGIRCGDGHPFIYGNVIEYNKAGYGCGIVMNYCKNAVIKNNLIVHNSGGQNYGGGGIWATGTNTTSVLFVENNTIANNHINGGGNYAGKGGGIFVFSVKLSTQNNIIYGNTQSSGNSVAAFLNGVVSVDYSNLDFPYAGTANISSNPLFLDTTFFLLSSASPCIDTGNPLAAHNDPTVTPNTALFPSRGTGLNDMGAYGDSLAILLSHCAASATVSTAIAEKENDPAFLIYPNPSAGKLFIKAAVPFEEGDGIIVWNKLGQKVSELSIPTSSELKEIDLQSTDLYTGLYTLELKSRNKVTYHKIIVVK